MSFIGFTRKQFNDLDALLGSILGRIKALEDGGGGGGGGGATPSSSDPLMDGTASAGTSAKYSRGDHVHPTDTSRAASDLGVTGASVGQVVKVKTVDASGKPTAFEAANESGGGGTPSSADPLMDGTASAGSSTDYARGDHVHPTDTSRAPAGLGITGASVGQVPTVAAVDQDGKPTSWAADTLDASDVGAIAAPSSPSTGAFLVYDGSAWAAQTLSTWQGGSY